ncbi:MAG: helix-turn-helix domain-containing protein [Terracidiphilus sp.]
MSRKSRYPFASHTPLPVLSAPSTTERLFTVQEAAEYLRLTPRTIGRYIGYGYRGIGLKASWIGRRWIISQSNLRAFIAANQIDALLARTGTSYPLER